MQRLRLWCWLLFLLLPVLAWGQALSRREVALLNPLEYGTTCTTATLSATIGAATTAGRVLMLTPVDRDGAVCTWAITSNLTVPSHITLHVPHGTSVSISSGVTLTLARYPREDNRAWKTGAGTLVIQEPHPVTGMINVKDMGAKGDNTTDDRTAIQAAITLAGTSGGGTIYFPPGTYYTGTTAGSVNVTVPVATATFQSQVQTVPYQFLATAISGLHFVGPGATLRSGYTLGGHIFLFDGCRNVTWDGINIQSVTTFNSAGVVSVAGMNALAFTATTQDSTRIILRNFAATATYASVYVFGDPALGFRVSDMQLTNILQLNNFYGMAFHNQGFGVQFSGIRAVGGARAYFIYGVRQHDGDILVETGSPDVQAFNAIMIKAYNFHTEDIRLRVNYRRVSTSVKVSFQSQHNVAAQPVPAQVRNINLDYNETGFAGGGGIDFAYYQDSTVIPSSGAKVFDNMTLRGIFVNDITTQTTFSGVGRVKLNLDNVTYVTGAPSILNNNTGFERVGLQAYQPVLAFGGASTGMTYAVQRGEYYEMGNFVFGSIQIQLTAKGSATGLATVTLPRQPSAQIAGNGLLQFMPHSNLAGLTQGFSAWMAAGTTECLLLQRNAGATGMDNLTHANFTNTSQIFLTFTYSK